VLIIVAVVIIIGGAYVLTKNKVEAPVIPNLDAPRPSEVMGEMTVYIKQAYELNSKKYIGVENTSAGSVKKTLELSPEVAISLQRGMYDFELNSAGEPIPTTADKIIDYTEMKRLLDSKDELSIINPWDIQVEDGKVVKIRRLVVVRE